MASPPTASAGRRRSPCSIAVGTLAEGSVASVREREALRRGPHRLSRPPVFVAAAPGFETLARTVVRELDESAPAPRSTPPAPTDPVLAAEANRYDADLFLAFRAGDAPGCRCSYFESGRFRSEAGLRGRRRGEPRARTRSSAASRASPVGPTRCSARPAWPRSICEPVAQGDVDAMRDARAARGPTWPTPSSRRAARRRAAARRRRRAVPPTRYLRAQGSAGRWRCSRPWSSAAVGHQPVDPLEVLEGRELDHDLAPARRPS